MIKNTEELLLLKNAKNGDEDAYFMLLENYRTLIKSMARKYFLIGAEMEDLVQEGSIGFVNAVNSYEEQKDPNFRAYALLCVKRAIFSAIKKYGAKKNKVFSDCLVINQHGAVEFGTNDECIEIVIPSSSRLPDDDLIWKERLQEIKEYITKSLSSYEKKVLAEFLKGKSYEQIGEIVNKNSASVENALSRIRSKLAPLK